MNVIGKANKFYTLWDISEDVRQMSDGRSYTITHYCFIKNLSFDKEAAMAKVPGAEVDETLRGHHSFERVQYQYPEPPADEFRYGKYSGTKVADCNDIDYLAWAWNSAWEMFSEEVKPIVESKLAAAGYRRLHDDSRFYSDPENVAAWEAEQEELDEFIDALSADKIEIDIPYNPDEDGTLRILNGNVEIKFKEVAEYYYQGYNYYLPLDSKGKAKRIKNKTLVITPKDIQIVNENRNTWNPVVTITVENFEIKK